MQWLRIAMLERSRTVERMTARTTTLARQISQFLPAEATDSHLPPDPNLVRHNPSLRIVHRLIVPDSHRGAGDWFDDTQQLISYFRIVSRTDGRAFYFIQESTLSIGKN